MTGYKKDEIFTATEVVRNFSAILGKISSKELKKVAILKNNRFEAILVNVEEYERLQEAVEILESIYLKQQKGENGN